MKKKLVALLLAGAMAFCFNMPFAILAEETMEESA